MAGNSIGTLFRLTTFGESHGQAIGGIVDGCPPAIPLSVGILQKELDRRKPSGSVSSTSRMEEDKLDILSGVFDGKTTGMPVAFIVSNKGHKSSDYDHIKNIYRPSHADYTVEKRYGIRDHRGGGRLSGRETLARVAGGAIAKAFIESSGIRIVAFTSSIGNVVYLPGQDSVSREGVYATETRCPDKQRSMEMKEVMEEAARQGDSVGGTITCYIENVPAGLGDPVFDKLHADLGKAVLSIGGVRGFEIGEGFNAAMMKGSEHNDEWIRKGEEMRTLTNHSGGVQGGISNGMPIWFKAAVKPVSSIGKKQRTIDDEGREVEFITGGRHDICIVPRAVPVVEAMTALVIADHLLRYRSQAQSGKSYEER
jgi:chorismate synthase